MASPLSKKDIIINLDTFKKNNGHIAKNLEVSNRVFIVDSQPELYEESMLALEFGLAYHGRKLINISDIAVEQYGIQAVRIGANEKRDEIETSIKHGWKLNTSPIAVVFEDEDQSKVKILEGRTRLGILSDLGITGQIVVDLYEHIDPTIDLMDFAAYCNGDEVSPPKGHTTEESAIMIIQNKLNSGELKSDPTLEKGAAYKKLKKDIDAVVKRLNLPLKSKQAEEFAKDAVKISTANIVEFTDKKVKPYCMDTFKLKDTEYVKYLPVTADEHIVGKEVARIYAEMLEEGEGHKELRLITYVQKLDPGKGYENHWILATNDVMEKIHQRLVAMVAMTGGDMDKCKVKVWGAIPQCFSMQEDFPMNKLVLFGKKLTAKQKETIAKFSPYKHGAKKKNASK
jgi:hypothetical protein